MDGPTLNTLLPAPAKHVASPQSSSRIQARIAVTTVGFLYMMLSVSCSSWYLTLVQPHVQSDIWWPDFNSTGVQAFLGDIVHSRLSLDANGTFDLASNRAALSKSYSGEDTVLTLPPTAPTKMLLANVPFDSAIMAMRDTTLDSFLGYRIPYCWIDFERTFELAHTARRQERCLRNDATNAAVYLDSFFRNVNSTALSKWSLLNEFNETVFLPLAAMSAKGSAWVDAVLQRTKLETVENEVAYWNSHGMARFTLQLRNGVTQQRLDNSIFIEDALGVQQRMTIYSVAAAASYSFGGTTFWASLSFSSEFNIAALLNCSVIRHASNDADAMGLSWDTDILFPGVQGLPGTDLMRTHVGPFGSIDIRTVPAPSQLATYFLSFRQSLYDYMQQYPADDREYSSLLEPTVDPTPPTWASMVFYGGNPMCPMGSPQPFIQSSFGVNDDCSNQVPYTIQLLRDNIFFALVSTGLTSPSDVCGLCYASSAACLPVLQAALPLVTSWDRTATFTQLNPPPLDVVSKLNISFMQFATAADGTQAMLLEPLVSPDRPSSSLWSFYGWVGIHDWLVGTREVYALEGDISTLTVLTESQAVLSLEANELEIPRKACFYIWAITVYITFVLVGIVTLMILYAFVIGFHVEWWNLFLCNWVIGSVWVGRPILFLRGMTAMVLLSSASISFETHAGFSRLVLTPRSFFSTMVVAGEATWLTIVLHDLLLPFSDQNLTLHAPISTALVWLILAIIEYSKPHVATVALQRTCTYFELGVSGSCTSAVVQFGSLWRLGCLCIVQLACIILVYGAVYFYDKNIRQGHRVVAFGVPHVLVPGIVHAFFIHSGHGDIYLDRVACAMCGMITYGNRLFHIPSWTMTTKESLHGVGYMFQVAKLSVPPPSNPQNDKGDDAATPSREHKYIRWMGLIGLGYMIGSVAGSYGYLLSVQTVMANDLWWEHFNSTAHQTYLSNWFNRQLQVTPQLPATLATNPQYGELGSINDYSSEATSVLTPPLYTSAVQLEANTLTNVITGLRQMSGCHVPWIATAYCYADFNRSWEMANTLARQQRCLAKEKQNGAVYLEAVLRNADWPSLLSCWNESLTIGVFSFMQTSNSGQQWLSSVQAGGTNSVGDEVALWQSHGITEYVTQWQNYKELGIFETFSIANAFGFSYPMTIKRSRGSMRTTEASSMKMYWSFASDLWAVSTNTTAIGGYHLIRQSPSFAFTNTSLADVMGQNGTLPWPLGRGLSLVEAELGPFGAIDVKRVACPSVLRQVYQNLTESLVVLVNVDSSSSSSYNWLLQKNTNHTQVVVDYMSLLQSNNAPFPLLAPAWDTTNVALCGGKLMCELSSCGGRLAQDFFSTSESCTEPFIPDAESPTKENVHKAMLAVDLHVMQTLDTLQFACSCALTTTDSCDACVQMLHNSTDFLSQSFTPSAVASFRTLAQTAETLVRDVLAIEMIQFASDWLNGTIDPSTNVSLSRANLFADPRMGFSSWLYLFDWVENRREVVTFIGDHGAVTTMSDHSAVVLAPANPRELPLSFSFYSYRMSQYITGVLFAVACLVCLYIINSVGRIEGMNMMTFNQVAGLVWIGRPLILLRSLTAICCLATADLVMDASSFRLVARLKEVPSPWYTTFLSTAELNWLVYVLEDILSVVTTRRTFESTIENPVLSAFITSFLTQSTILSWTISGTWSAVNPVQHSVTLHRTCELPNVDLDIACNSGTFIYGSVSRFVSLVILAAACAVGAFGLKLLLLRASATPRKVYSAFLPAVAQNSFNFSKWEVHDMYYLDKPSAILAGILVFESGHTYYAFDVKNWRCFAIDAKAPRKMMEGVAQMQHLYHALPLVE